MSDQANPCGCKDGPFKQAWKAYGMQMVMGAICALVGMVIGVLAVSDIKVSVTVQPKPQCCKPAPVIPCPEPTPPCPCKPKKPGDSGEFEAGPCECQDCKCPDCQCPDKDAKPRPSPKPACKCGDKCPKGCGKEACKKNGCKDCKNCPGCK